MKDFCMVFGIMLLIIVTSVVCVLPLTFLQATYEARAFNRQLDDPNDYITWVDAFWSDVKIVNK